MSDKYKDITAGFIEDEQTVDSFDGTALSSQALTAAGLSMSEVVRLNKECELDQTRDYGEPEYLLYQGDVGFMSRGDIQAIKAAQKNGKSMLMDIFMGTMIRGKYGCLKSNGKPLKVLYIDTEQSERNTSLQSKRVKTIVGRPLFDKKDDFQILTLRGQGEDMCRAIVEYRIRCMQPDAVFIDGIKDLCKNFNDIECTASLIRWEMNLSKYYNLALCSVLHVNPNSDKMRGHLGTEEQNKCSDVFTVIKHKEENSPIWFEVKQTDARNRDVSDFSFVCQGEFGTPVMRIPDIPSTLSTEYTIAKPSDKNSGKTTTINITDNAKCTILNYLKSTLSIAAVCESNLVNNIRHGCPTVKISSDDKARAWISWAVDNGFIAYTTEGTTKKYRWRQGAVIPPQDEEFPF